MAARKIFHCTPKETESYQLEVAIEFNFIKFTVLPLHDGIQ